MLVQAVYECYIRYFRWQEVDQVGGVEEGRDAQYGEERGARVRDGGDVGDDGDYGEGDEDRSELGVSFCVFLMKVSY